MDEMSTTIVEEYLVVKTNFDGHFNVTIQQENDRVIFSETMISKDKEIVLKGFSLNTHKVIIAPIKAH